MADTNDWRAREARNKFRGCAMLAIAFCGVVAIAIAALGLLIYSAEKRAREASFKHRQEQLDETIAAIRSGKHGYIYLYDSAETDRLIERLVGVPGVETVHLDMTDVTDDGMKSLATLKNLKTLKINGGRCMHDQGVSYLSEAPSLEDLELINTRVTDQCLPALKNLPNLRFLNLQHSANCPTQFTTAGLQDLKALTKLKRLYISGGLASDAAVKELREALPNCAINEKDDSKTKMTPKGGNQKKGK